MKRDLHPADSMVKKHVLHIKDTIYDAAMPT